MFDTPYMFPTDDFRRFPFWYFVGREFDSFGKPTEKNMLTESFQNALPDLIDSDDLTLLNQILRRKYRDYLVRDHYFVTSKVETIHYTETVKTNFEINFNAPADIAVENLRFAATYAYTINVPEWSYSYYDKAIGDVGNVKTIQPKSFTFDNQLQHVSFKCVVNPSTVVGDLTWNLILESQDNPAGWVTAWFCFVDCHHTVFPQEYQKDLFNLYLHYANPSSNTEKLTLTNTKNLISTENWYGIGPTNKSKKIQTTLDKPIKLPAPIDKPAVVYFNLKDDLNLYPEYVLPYGETKVEPYEGFQYSDKTVYAQQFQIDYTPAKPEQKAIITFDTNSEELQAWADEGTFSEDGTFTPKGGWRANVTITNTSSDSPDPIINTGTRSMALGHSDSVPAGEEHTFYMQLREDIDKIKHYPFTYGDFVSATTFKNVETPFNLLTMSYKNDTTAYKIKITSYDIGFPHVETTTTDGYPAHYNIRIYYHYSNNSKTHTVHSLNHLAEKNNQHLYFYIDESSFSLASPYTESDIDNWLSNYAIVATTEKPSKNLFLECDTSNHTDSSGLYPIFINEQAYPIEVTLIPKDNVYYRGTSTVTSGSLTYIFSVIPEEQEYLIGVPSITVEYGTGVLNVSGTVNIPANNHLIYAKLNIPEPIAYGDTNYLFFYAPDSPASWTKEGFENLVNENATWLITAEDPRGKSEYEHIFGLWTLTVSNNPSEDDQIHWNIKDFIPCSNSYNNPATDYNPYKVTAKVEVFPYTWIHQEAEDEKYDLTIGDLYQKEVKVETPLPLKPPEDTSDEWTSMGLDAKWTKVETFDRTREETIHKFEPFVDETLKVLENVSIQLAKIHGTEWKAYKKASEVYYSYIVEEGLTHESVKETEQSNGTENYSPNLQTTKDTNNTQTDNYTIEGSENYSTDTTGSPKEEHSGGTRSEVTPTLLQSSTEETSRTANDPYTLEDKPVYIPQDKSVVSNTYSAKNQITENTDTTVKSFTTDNHETGNNTTNTTNNGTSKVTGKTTESTTGTADTTKHNAHDRQLKRVRTPWKTIEDVWNNPEYEWLFKIADDIAEELFIQSYSF